MDLVWFFSVLCLLCLCTRASVYTCMCLVVNDWERASWLSFVVSNCEFVTFPLVSFVRCGTCLFRFLIFAPLLTFIYLELNVPQQTLVNLQVISNHIKDKLAVSFDSSSIGRTSYMWFPTIDAKYSSVKTYNEENSSF